MKTYICTLDSGLRVIVDAHVRIYKATDDTPPSCDAIVHLIRTLDGDKYYPSERDNEVIKLHIGDEELNGNY